MQRQSIFVASSGCPSASCGSNSPVINVFPYNGLHPDGCINRDGAGLVKFSLQSDRSQCEIAATTRLYLDVAPTDHGYELVGKDEHDSVKCKGTALVGATFVVTWKQNAVTLRISQMAMTDIGRTRSTHAATGSAQTRAIYLITPAEQPAESLCIHPSGLTESSTPILNNRSRKDGRLAHIADDEIASYALIVPGAVYDYSAQLITESVTPMAARDPGKTHRWFNIACASDALAQTELSGLVTEPIIDVPTAQARLPALHMFAAKYCDGLSGTTRGTAIAWSPDGKPPAAARAGAIVGPIEAQWGAGGATCVSHSRLWTENKIISLPAQLLQTAGFNDPQHPWTYPLTEDDFLSRLCHGSIPRCDATRPSSTLTSYTVNYGN